MAHRIETAKRGEPKWDRNGQWSSKCSQLADYLGLDFEQVWDEHLERSGGRHFAGGMEPAEAEQEAFGDVLERYQLARTFEL